MPPKAAYLELATNPSLEFEYYLASKLTRTVAELREMSGAEYAGWVAYYQRKAQREELEMRRHG